MKGKLILTIAILAILAMCMPVSAETTTERVIIHTPYPCLSEYLNTNEDFFATYEQYEPENMMGIGANFKLIDFTKIRSMEKLKIFDCAQIEYKYDVNNKNHSGFLVFEFDLTTLWQ